MGDVGPTKSFDHLLMKASAALRMAVREFARDNDCSTSAIAIDLIGALFVSVSTCISDRYKRSKSITGFDVKRLAHQEGGIP